MNQHPANDQLTDSVKVIKLYENLLLVDLLDYVSLQDALGRECFEPSYWQQVQI